MESAINDDSLLSAIIKNCYWDYDITMEDIRKITASDDFRQKQKLFDRIIRNDRNRVLSLRIFDEQDLPQLFDSLHTGHISPGVQEHILALRNLFLGERNVIERLQWKKR